MRGERIFYANSAQIGIDGFKKVIRERGEAAKHEVVMTATTPEEIDDVILEIMKSPDGPPTVFAVDPDHMLLEEWKNATLWFKAVFPKVKVITISTWEDVNFGDENYKIPQGGFHRDRLVKIFTDLEH